MAEESDKEVSAGSQGEQPAADDAQLQQPAEPAPSSQPADEIPASTPADPAASDDSAGNAPAQTTAPSPTPIRPVATPIQSAAPATRSFKADEATLQKLAGQANALPMAKPAEPAPVAAAVWPQPAAAKISLSQILLLLNTVLIIFLVGALIYVLTAPVAEEPQVAQIPQAPSAPASAPATSPAAEALADLPTHQEPVTWEQAEQLIAEGKFQDAEPIFAKLAAAAAGVPAQQRVADFFRLRLGQCQYELGNREQAAKTLADLSASQSPVVAAVAAYYRARVSLDLTHYHSARLYAYQAIASLGCLEGEQPLESDCDYLVAMSLTRQALAFGDQELALAGREPRPHDPFVGLDRVSLQSFLALGSDRVNASPLGPALWRLDDGPIGRRWVANATSAGLEDLLQRFASQAGLEMQWDEIPPVVRQRGVTLCLQGVSEQRLVEVAAGLAGLTTRYTGQTVMIHDLQAQASLTKQRNLTAQSGIMAWRRFALRYGDDARAGRGHFALACLLDSTGEGAAALSSYQVLARRYPTDALAPSALLQSAMLRIRLRDYVGARADLLDLLDRYPASPSFEQVYLKLGQSTYEAGMSAEASRVYSRLYHLDVAARTKLQACLGAAQCFFNQKDYSQTVEWVNRYLKLSDQAPGRELAAAYVVRAQAARALGDVQQAHDSFNAALASGPSRQHYVLSLLELARIDLEQGRLVPVLGALARLEEVPLDQEQLFSMLVISSRTHRAMGLAPTAVRTLRGKLAGFTDPILRSRLQVEYAHCLGDDGDSDTARAVLEEAMPSLPAGAELDEASCDLAEMCLQTGRVDQALTLTNQALARQMEPAQRQRALEILGAAHLQRKQYPQAAQAFSGLLAQTPEAQVQP